jgi:signal transduction histidine kinase
MDIRAWLAARSRPPLTARQWAADAVLALAVAVVQTGGGLAGAWHGRPVAPGDVALLAAGGAVLAARRRYPVAVLAATYVTVFAYLATQPQGQAGWLASIIAFCTAVYLGKRAAAVGFLAACYAASLWGPMLAGGRGPSPMFALGLGAGLALLVVVAELIRLRGQRALAQRQRREEEARRRASEERLRVARDLHDVVAHNISVINVQANTALHLMDRQPERARSALTTISEVSKQALVEVRTVLGVLRDVDARAPRAPIATLARLPELAENARAAGVNVWVAEMGGDPLPAAVDLAAYRIVQEALTNCVRHAPGTSAVVVVRHDGRDLVVEVTDDGPAPHGPAPAGRPGTGGDGSGNGIVGMTERANALGGALEAGPRPDGGFRVRARLPLNGGTSPGGTSIGETSPGGSADDGWGARGITASHGGTP